MLAFEGVYDPASTFPIPEVINREMNCLKYDQNIVSNVKEDGNDMTNTSIYEEEDD